MRMDLQEQMASLAKAAVDTWGERSQADMAVEECAELIAAIRHFDRGKCGGNAVIEEIADVMIMLEQLGVMFGREEVNDCIDAKLKRLNERIDRTFSRGDECIVPLTADMLEDDPYYQEGRDDD